MSTIKFFNSFAVPKRTPPTELPVASFIEVVRAGISPCYELVPDDYAKVFFDVDREVECGEFSNATASRMTDSIEQYIHASVGGHIAVATSHSPHFMKNNNKTVAKYSMRYWVPNFAGDRAALAALAKELNDHTPDDIREFMRNEVLFDLSVYDSNRKMRCVNTSKPGQDRPLTLVKGTIEDTIISSCFADDVQRIVAPPSAEPVAVAVGAPPTHTEVGEVERIVRAGIAAGVFDRMERDYRMWVDIGFVIAGAMGKEGEDLFVDLSRSDPVFIEDAVRAKYAGFVTNPKHGKKVGVGTLVYHMKKVEGGADVCKSAKREQKLDEAVASGVRFAIDDTQAAGMIIKDLEGRLMADGDGRVFMKSNNIWFCDTNQVDDRVTLCIRRSGISREVNGEVKSYTQNVSAAKNVLLAVLQTIRVEHRVHDLGDKFHSTMRGRLCFEDGILDIAEKKFYLWEDITFECYPIVQIPYAYAAYAASPDLAMVAKVKELLLEPLFGAKMELALHFLARGIAGNSSDKNWGNLLGSRDCGKGVLYDALKAGFHNYIETFDVMNLMHERASTIKECARMKAWLLPFEHARIAIAQETPNPNESDIKLNGALLKSIVSGGDVQEARNNYDRVATKFKTSASIFIMGNFELRSDQNDVWEHCVKVDCTVQWKPQAYINEEKAKNPEQPLLWNMYRPENDKIKDIVKTDAFRNALVWALVDAWRPTAVVISHIASTDENEKKVREVILDRFEITGKDDDTILMSQVYARMVDVGGQRKIAAEFAAMGIQKEKIAKGANRGKWQFVGVVVIPDKKEDDESN